MGPTLYSVGHGARPVEELLDILRSAGIERLVDVRSFPGSRKHPQFGKDALAETLASAHIDYVWRQDLGGFRKPREDSPHSALRHPAFRGYADHMDTAEFRAGIARLLDLAHERPTAIMCAEAVPWRCHRQLIADALVACGVAVRHALGPRSTSEHALTAFARVEGECVVYDRGQLDLDAAASGVRRDRR